LQDVPLFLIDAYGLIYRFYFAFLNNPLRNSAGKNVSALFGFSRTVIQLLDSESRISDQTSPRSSFLLAAVFDSRTPTFRHKMYPEYKATRQKAPDELHAQVPLVEEFLAALNISALRVDGFEADDIIATLAKKCREEKRQCYIISSDKDLLQLVREGTYQLRPVKSARDQTQKTAAMPWDIIGPEQVKIEWGVPPEKILDLLSLAGDSSDNIPGVKGIGEKTAIELMTRYGSLNGIYQNIAGISGSKGKKLAEGKESAYFSQSLIRLDSNVPLPIKSLDELSTDKLNKQAGAKVLFREGLRQGAKQLDSQITGEVHTKAQRHNVEEESNKKEGLQQVDSSLLGDGNYHIIKDIGELTGILAEAKKQKLLALDFETDSLDAWNSRPIGISLALKPKEAYYVPLAPHGVAEDGTAADPDHLDPEQVRKSLAPLLSDPAMTITAHNAKYDYKVSRGWGLERWQCTIWDTMVAAWLVEPDRNNYSLDSLVSYTFNYTPIVYKDIVPKGRVFDSVSLETAARYSAEDADLCMRMMRILEPQLHTTGAMQLFSEIEMPLVPVLAEMEGIGIKIEPKVLTDFGKELEVELDTIQRDARKMAGREFNLASPKQLQEILFVERKLTPGKKIKTGYSTDAASLEELAREDPLPALILRHRTLAKLKSTYVDTLADMADSEGRLHTNYDQCGTATGRLSSREPNLQNIPIRAEEGRRIREAFVAHPGSLLISADYSQIELVILAHLSGDKNLVAAFTEGTDVHARTAALIFGISEDNVQSDQRRIAKTINFGVMYGMSAFRLANELGISRTDASNFITAYFNTYAGVRAFIEDLIKKSEECGYASTILGRRRPIPTINSRNKTEKAAAERIAVNTPIQGSAADIVKTAMLNLDRRLAAAQSPARLLLQVHDELIFECPRDTASESAELIKTEMEHAVSLRVPLRVSVETASHWSSFH